MVSKRYQLEGKGMWRTKDGGVVDSDIIGISTPRGRVVSESREWGTIWEGDCIEEARNMMVEWSQRTNKELRIIEG